MTHISLNVKTSREGFLKSILSVSTTYKSIPIPQPAQLVQYKCLQHGWLDCFVLCSPDSHGHGTCKWITHRLIQEKRVTPWCVINSFHNSCDIYSGEISFSSYYCKLSKIKAKEAQAWDA